MELGLSTQTNWNSDEIYARQQGDDLFFGRIIFIQILLNCYAIDVFKINIIYLLKVIKSFWRGINK